MRRATMAAAFSFAVLAVSLPSAAAPVPDIDPLVVGAQWKGKLTQRGTFAGTAGPPQFEVVFVVTRRERTRFQAELQEKTTGLKITYLVKGEISRPAKGMRREIQFESFDSKDVESTTPVLGVAYKAVVSGKSLKGTWKFHRGSDQIDIEGDFELLSGK